MAPKTHASRLSRELTRSASKSASRGYHRPEVIEPVLGFPLQSSLGQQHGNSGMRLAVSQIDAILATTSVS